VFRNYLYESKIRKTLFVLEFELIQMLHVLFKSTVKLGDQQKVLVINFIVLTEFGCKSSSDWKDWKKTLVYLSRHLPPREGVALRA
jgi:hypothetical protein